MAIRVEEVVLHVRKILIFSVRQVHRSARHHPILSGLGVLLLVLYRAFPSIFSFLLSSSPVIICTTLLLGVILSYGKPNIPELEEEDTTVEKISSLNVTAATDDLHVKSGQEIVETTVKETLLGAHHECDETTPLMRGYNEQDERAETSSAAASSSKNRNIVSEERVLDVRAVCQQEELVEEKSAGTERMAVADVESDKAMADNQVDSSLGSPWQKIDGHDGLSDFESDMSESSSPDASMADILPLLDEIHPLLDSESPHPAPISKYDSDAGSQVSSLDPQVDDDSADEAENRVVENEGADLWTADDQKNLMDLGYSELERNRRLENLMTRRRSRQDVILELDKNLIDLDGNHSELSTDDLSSLRVQVPPISGLRANPFELPYDSDEPLSAPSILLPRSNPFDLPYNEPSVSSILPQEAWTPREFTPSSHRDDSHRRHERGFSRFKPRFAGDTMDLEEGSSATYQRQFNDKSELKLSSVLESDTVSSANDEEHHKDPAEQNMAMDEACEIYSSSSGFDEQVRAVPDLLSWDDEVVRDQPAGESNLLGNISDVVSSSRLDEVGSTSVAIGASTRPEVDMTDWNSNSNSLMSSDNFIPCASETVAATTKRSVLELSSGKDETIEHNIVEFDVEQDSSAVSSSVPTHDGGLARSEPLDSKEGVNLSSLVDTTSGDLAEFDLGLGKSRENSTNADPQRYLNDSDLEDDKIYPDPNEYNEYNEIDEDLLSELDAVGDFHVQELRAVQQTSGIESEADLKHGDEHQSTIDRPEAIESEVETLFNLSHADPEQTVYNPQQPVLRASSIEEIEATQTNSQTLVVESKSIGEVTKTTMPESEILTVEVKSVADIDLAFEQVTKSAMAAIEAKSMEDIDPACIKVTEGLDETSDVGIGASKVLLGEMDMEPAWTTEHMETDSGMEAIEAESIDDIVSAFKQISGRLSGSSLLDAGGSSRVLSGGANLEPIETSDESMTGSQMLVVDAKSVKDIMDITTTDLEMLAVEAKSVEVVPEPRRISELTMTDSGMLAIEAESIDDIVSAFKQVSGGLGRSSSLDDAGSSKALSGGADLEPTEISDRSMVDSQMVVVEAKSIEDLHSVFSKVIHGRVDLEPASISEMTNTDSGMEDLEAKSIQDIDSALERVCEGSDKTSKVLLGGIDSQPTAMHSDEPSKETEIKDGHSASEEMVAGESGSCL